MYSYAATIFNIDIIHVFFEVGQPKWGDATHALIKDEKNQLIYVPEQWTTLVRCAKTTGKLYNVGEITQESILNFRRFMEQKENWKIIIRM